MDDTKDPKGGATIKPQAHQQANKPSNTPSHTKNDTNPDNEIKHESLYIGSASSQRTSITSQMM